MATSIRLLYRGPHDAVEIPDGAGVVKRGGQLVCTPELADGLLAQTHTDPESGKPVPCFTAVATPTPRKEG